MRFFNIDPEQIRREASSGKPARELLRNGKGALFATYRAFQNDQVQARMQEYLHGVLPTLDGVTIETTTTSVGRQHGSQIRTGGEDAAGEPKSLKFVLQAGSRHLAFDPQNISDGTLRAFGVLLALFQSLDPPASNPIPLIAIEEPESALHPAAAGVLFDALRESSCFTQVLVSTHSPDLLDVKDLDVDSVLVVNMVDGETVIAPADEVSKSIMRDRLYTAGELLKLNQLRLDLARPESVGMDTGEGDLPPSADKQ